MYIPVDFLTLNEDEWHLLRDLIEEGLEVNAAYQEHLMDRVEAENVCEDNNATGALLDEMYEVVQHRSRLQAIYQRLKGGEL